MDDWMFIPGVLKIMKKFNEVGFIIIIVSNQGGIELKYQTEEDTLKKFHNIKKEAKSFDVDITKFFYCTTNFPKHNDRKPNPGMALKAAEEFNIDLNESVMVGDLDTDRQFAINSGIPTYIDIKDFLTQ
jgi:D-glycero-D-manno-heptose 1,7-bisphosphate phosphatase